MLSIRHVMMLFSCCVVLAGGLAAPARGVVVCQSEPTLLDLQLPEISPVFPLEGAALYPENTYTFSWSIAECHFGAVEVPIACEIIIDDAISFSIEIEPALAGNYQFEWVAPDLESENCHWRITAIDSMRNTSSKLIGPFRIATSGTGVESRIPEVVSLAPNYPNPFNPTTRLGFALPAGQRARLTVYDIQGRMVELLIDEFLPAGHHSCEWAAAGCASGVYFSLLETDTVTLSRKLLLLK
ncbi:MAG: T9SS type A sorting domain-containing protein [bacterium]|nr:T9SS type A sorting domain-containing protein [bacterium]